MKTLIAFLFTSLSFAQSPVSTDLQTVQTALSKAIMDAALPPPVPIVDPVLALIKASPGVYTALQTCLTAKSSTCQVFAVVYSCTRPVAWAPSTPYLLGAYVSDSAGNIYQLTAIANSAGVPLQSGTAITWNTTALGAVTVDGPYTWTLSYTPAIAWSCSASTIP